MHLDIRLFPALQSSAPSGGSCHTSGAVSYRDVLLAKPADALHTKSVYRGGGGCASALLGFRWLAQGGEPVSSPAPPVFAAWASRP